MTTATYALYIDWNADGDFLDAAEDCSANLMAGTTEQGFGSPLARLGATGRATLSLWNTSRLYSPAQTANVLPRRAVKLDMTYNAVTVTLFRGFIEAIRPSAGQWRERVSVIECVDALALLGLHEGAIAVQTNALADALISPIVSAVYTPPSTDYQAGVTFFPVSADKWELGGIGFEAVPAAQKLEAVCAADWGRFWVAGSGAPTFRNRHAHLGAAVALTLEADGSLNSLSYQKSASTIYNHIEITCHPRAVGTVNERLASIGGAPGAPGTRRAPPQLAPSEAKIFELEYKDAATQGRLGALSALTPVAGTDYACTSDEAGDGTDLVGSVSVALTAYGDRCEVTLTNNAAQVVYVQLLQVRGLAVRARQPVTVVATDATSITAYQRRKLRLNLPLLSSEAEAQALAAYLLARFKTPVETVTVEFDGVENATLMAAARDLELLDKVQVSEYQTGLSSFAGFVRSLKRSFGTSESGVWHMVSLELEALPTSAEFIFTLHTSTTDFTNVLTESLPAPTLIY